MRRLIKGAIAFLFVGFFLLGYRIHDAWIQPLSLPEIGSILVVNQGQSLRTVLMDLTSKTFLYNPEFISWRARLLGLDDKMQAGEYMLEPGIRASDLLVKLTRGEVIQHSVTLPEGITLKDALHILSRQSALRSIVTGPDDPALIEMVGDWPSAEGWFLPETWWFTKGDSDLDLLLRAHQAIKDLLKKMWDRQEISPPLSSPYEALILASIVERETGVPSERAEIAGVFLKRLGMSMRLQTDPTVIYGLGESYDGDLKRIDLRDRSNPYNTYVIGGLPPTPIALPSEASIRAVFWPRDTDSLYFVAKGDGTHAFSASLTEHQKKVRKYQLLKNAEYRSIPAPKRR